MNQTIQKYILKRAFQLWSNVTNIDFIEIFDNSTNEAISIVFFNDSSLPYLGITDLHSTSINLRFNDGKKLETVIPTGTFYKIAIHEIGHILGLSHTNIKNCIMFESVDQTSNSLCEDDLKAVQSIYGSRSERDSMGEEGPILPSVFPLIEGYCKETGAANAWMACGSVTLVKQGSLNVLVDCGSPWDSARLLEELKKHDLRPQNIQYVVCTHGHIDHIGNLNLFTESQILLDTDFGTKPGFYGTHNYNGDHAFPISDHIDVILTPGHTHRDLSVVVRNVDEKGTVVIAGDLFESEADLENDQLWQQTSFDIKLQTQSRRQILEIADWIVPGHGPMFQVPDDGKSLTASSHS